VLPAVKYAPRYWFTSTRPLAPALLREGVCLVRLPIAENMEQMTPDAAPTLGARYKVPDLHGKRTGKLWISGGLRWREVCALRCGITSAMEARVRGDNNVQTGIIRIRAAPAQGTVTFNNRLGCRGRSG